MELPKAPHLESMKATSALFIPYRERHLYHQRADQGFGFLALS